MCIPTENSVQKPELLYAPHIAGYAVRTKVPQWQEKVPCKAIVDSIDNRDARELFEKINFCKSLSLKIAFITLLVLRIQERKKLITAV